MPGSSSIFDIGGAQFGVEDCKIATNNLDGTFGTLYDVPSIQLVGVQVNTVNAQLEGDDTITDTHARAISLTCNIRMGSVHLDVIEVLSGQDVAQSGTGATMVRSMRFRNANFPYFGLCARALATGGGGDTHIFVPKLKVMEGFSIQFEYGAYAIPEFTAMAVIDIGYYSDLFNLLEYQTARSIVIPPVYVAA